MEIILTSKSDQDRYIQERDHRLEQHRALNGKRTSNLVEPNDSPKTPQRTTEVPTAVTSEVIGLKRTPKEKSPDAPSPTSLQNISAERLAGMRANVLDELNAADHINEAEQLDIVDGQPTTGRLKRVFGRVRKALRGGAHSVADMVVGTAKDVIVPDYSERWQRNTLRAVAIGTTALVAFAAIPKNNQAQPEQSISAGLKTEAVGFAAPQAVAQPETSAHNQFSPQTEQFLTYVSGVANQVRAANPGATDKDIEVGTNVVVTQDFRNLNSQSQPQ